MNCRNCNTKLWHEFINLGHAPLSNDFLRECDLTQPETYYPLRLFVCDHCFLVQTQEYKKATDIFTKDYVYYSSFSKTWLAHADSYARMIKERLKLGPRSKVIEIASNDGYLLQFFEKMGIPCLGIEPAGKAAEVAMERGIDTITEFFGSPLAERLVDKGESADLIIGNNVFAHVPNLNDFVEGLRILLSANKVGVITLEFPHIVQMIAHNQFDTIYHEHFSYFSFTTAKSVLEKHDLVVFDVEELSTHGGSLRVYAGHPDTWSGNVSERVYKLLQLEKSKGICSVGYYDTFKNQALDSKLAFMSFIIDNMKRGKKIVGYGAAAKGNTFLNYCGNVREWIPFVVDANPQKQGKFLPGSHIPVVAEEEIRRNRPDYVLILPWNIRGEIMDHLRYVKEWGAKFIVAIPEIEIF